MLKRTKNAVRNQCSDAVRNFSWRDTLHQWIPITEWLPRYSLKKDFPADIAAGLTLGIMNIPQGLAFAMLASLPAITGLYVAFVPVLAYAILGTSRQLSIGTFAVISIMVADVIDEKKWGENRVASTNGMNGTMSNETPQSPSSGRWSEEDKEKIILSATLCFVIGLQQIAMGLLRLGFITIFLSDPLISGFTTGAGCWVFTSQVKHVLALYPRYRGPFALVKTYVFIVKSIPDINFASFVIGSLCIIILLVLKHINEKHKDKLKFPIPAELIVVALSAGISYGAKLQQKYGIKIVKSVPLGLPPLSVPRPNLISGIFVQGFVISVVSFTINISLGKLFAQKHGYPIDANQELIAYGAQHFVSGFFSCFASSANLGRSLIQDSMGRSQISNVVSCAIILLVLTALAPLFEPLPNAVLGAIVIVAIRKVFKNFVVVKTLWPINKTDAMTWVMTWLAVILFGIDFGLGIGVIFQLMCLLYRLSKPKFSILGEVEENTGVYDDINRVKNTNELAGVVIVRFQSPLCFLNIERFKKKLEESVFFNCKRTGTKSKCRYPKEHGEEKITISNSASLESVALGSFDVASDVDQAPPEDYVHSVIIDCSAFSFIDSSGASTLSKIGLEYAKKDIKLYLVDYSYQVLKVLETGKVVERCSDISLLPTISEALHHAHERRHKQLEHFITEEQGSSPV